MTLAVPGGVLGDVTPMPTTPPFPTVGADTVKGPEGVVERQLTIVAKGRSQSAGQIGGSTGPSRYPQPARPTATNIAPQNALAIPFLPWPQTSISTTTGT